MAKKRGKIRPKKASGSPVKRAKKAKKPVDEKHEAPDPFSISLKDLEILTEQKKVEKKIGEIENKETSIEKKESAIQAEEKKVEAETEKVERIEKRIEQQVTPKPLKALKFTDINKGIVGAFIGVVAHYAFIYVRDWLQADKGEVDTQDNPKKGDGHLPDFNCSHNLHILPF